MSDSAPKPSGRAALLDQHPWIAYVGPFIVFALLTTLEPTPESDERVGLLDFPYAWYPWIYTAKIALTIAAVLWCWPALPGRSFRISPLAIAVGVAGIFIWVGIWSLHLEQRLLPEFLQGGSRSSFNPLAELGGGAGYAFLVVRFIGLAIAVPIIEELFMRGFFMRYYTSVDWPTLDYGKISYQAAAVATAFSVAMHPERFAMLVWFTMVTLLMYRTRNIWDCIVAHAVTNFLLGVYVVTTGNWELM
ncbi:MAG: CAAX prenyl protease-related protein [Pirellulales bacterium]